MSDAIVDLVRRADPTVFVTLCLVFGFAFGTAVVSTIIKQVFAYRRRERELEFKREVLIHGVSAEEIERALAAAQRPSDTGSRPSSAAFRETQDYKGHAALR